MCFVATLGVANVLALGNTFHTHSVNSTYAKPLVKTNRDVKMYTKIYFSAIFDVAKRLKA